MESKRDFDVIIIGGSYAGLSAAMALGRSMQNVLIIDGGLPCNRQTPHSHNLITHDGEKPSVITEKAKTQVLNYSTVKFHVGQAVSGQKTARGFEISTQKKEIFEAKKLIFATGIKDLMPDIKGFSACWGISAIHCPYCHGYEYRNQPTGILMNGERAFHIASLVNNLSDRITIFTSGPAALSTDQLRRLAKRNINIIEKEITELTHENGRLKNVVFNDGESMALHAIYASLPFEQQSDIPLALGCEFTEQGYIKVDSFQQTTVKGIFACGDNSNMMRSVANAIAAGGLAGAMTNREITEEQF
ncbi:MAG: NAD(P)/FAD-dependent oxidoreductase [Bacteroidia bacterium]